MPAAENLTAEELFRRASPAVVKLIIKDSEERAIGSASGFVVGRDSPLEINDKRWFTSIVATNQHVIRPAISIDSEFSDNTKGFVFSIVAEDVVNDISLLEVLTEHEHRHSLTISKAQRPAIGARVFAIGSPKGLKNTLSEGIISGYRDLDDGTKVMQITAPISPGSSGGPLLLSTGCVVGVTSSFLREGQNLNFAIPASELFRLIEAPTIHRPLWDGASEAETARNAFLGVEIALRTRFASEQRSRTTSSQDPNVDNFPRFLSTLTENGDQDALIYEGDAQYKSNRLEFAIDYFTRATNGKPNRFAYLAWYGLGMSHYARFTGAQDPEKAVQALEKASKLNPDFAPAHYWSAYIYYIVLHRYPEALAESDASVRLMPRSYQSLKLRGTVWNLLRNLKRAEDDFKAAIDLRPNDADLYREFADAYSNLKQHSQAIEAYKTAIEINPDDWTSYESLGIEYRDTGDYSKATSSLEEALKKLRMKSGLPKCYVDVESTEKDIQGKIIDCRRRLGAVPKP